MKRPPGILTGEDGGRTGFASGAGAGCGFDRGEATTAGSKTSRNKRIGAAIPRPRLYGKGSLIALDHTHHPLDNLARVTHLVLFDGVCGLCDHFVQFLLRIDGHDRLRFAALQGPQGAEILKRHGRRADDALETVIVVADYDKASPRLLDRSDAAIFAIASVGGIYRAAGALRIVPSFLRNATYNLIARWRYRIFGRFDACPIPAPGTRAKFLDFPPGPAF